MYWGRKNPLGWEYQDPASIAIFVGTSFRVKYFRVGNQSFLPLYQIFIYEIAILPLLRKFWKTIWGKLAHKGPTTASIRAIRIRLPELQDDDRKTMKLRSEGLSESWVIKEMLYYQGLSYVPKVICSELSSRYHNYDLLIGHWSIKKTEELIAKNYYWPTLRKNVEAYIKSSDVCLTSKKVCQKLYGDPQSLPILTYL